MSNKEDWAVGIIATIIVAIMGYYLSQAVTEVSPEKQEVVTEGFSGSREPVIVTHKEFTGHNKGIVVTPEKPEIITGYSKVPFPIPPKFPEVDVIVDGHKYNCVPE